MGFGSDYTREQRMEDTVDELEGELRDVHRMHQEYVDRLKQAIRNLEINMRRLDNVGGGYDPSEVTRLAGKIQGAKLALSYWEEMNRG